METRANHLLIGGVALLTVAALAAFAVWLAQVSFTEMQRYRIYFTESVAGLDTGAAVNLNGIEVGNVREIRFDPGNPGRVIVSVDIESDAPIHADATVSLESQGFTGQQHVGISDGTADAPMLEVEGDGPPVIPSKPSAITQLMNSAPEIASRVREVVDRASELLDEAQREDLSATIAAVRDVSQQLAKRDEEIGRMLEDAAASAQSMDRAGERRRGRRVLACGSDR